jgi:predicted nucleic acid-binding protein
LPAAGLAGASAPPAGGIPCRTLGKTGLKVAPVGYGAGFTPDPSVIVRAVDMGVNYFDTNVLLYAHDAGAGARHRRAVELLERLFEDGAGALSFQVLAEFYWAATRKLGMKSEEAEQAIRDLGGWIIHCPAHADLVKASRLRRRHKLAWWDALVLNSATELGCSVLWSEDFSHGRRFGPVTVSNPFR